MMQGSKVLFRELGRVQEGSRREWVSPPPSPLQNLTGEFRDLINGLETASYNPEPNRRLLAFYNICAEYKKAIFQVYAPMSYIGNST